MIILQKIVILHRYCQKLKAIIKYGQKYFENSILIINKIAFIKF